MITVSGLNKSFQQFKALSEVDFSIQRSEVVSVIGPSGSGKSTLLRCLNLLVKPDSGHLQIGEQHIDAETLTRKQTAAFRRQTSMVFQHYNLFKNKTALQNITEILIYTLGFTKAQAHERGMDLLSQVGLAHKADAYPATLSGGQQQRVGIARALSVDPQVILLDEPTSSLDPEMRRDVLNLIAGLADRKLTMMIVTHEMSFARDVSDRIFFMEHGKIIEQGKPGQIFRASAETRTRAFLHDYA
ncbi:amino acid ABC transporter ATP-binding protein [Rouxiella chamberiensis]|uniref:Amino acid ABC transporter ATP-binding protein n=1 Tax=Rouxiella chamberiensis TaxID=1513468 RepID=A0ABY7HSL9_9GAMM|nr:amino acid ABC transporter ATP-binding protein [Rouxiella chamberiensis]WAT02355.1 amino acid ABC transporter ATP-binding protein [Rouxiella chamberiensis]